ncbi:FAD-binding oxidoreductase [Sphaerisporangium album]|uniref:FAD-binding oxidoreductase n=1 Tax=Sphaerisporangium album TaxID=509200 RepID=A0A367F9S2_9ACTN|nr:FAD-binding oxidoreductase [Sphaerisporangium album]
MRVAVIGNGIVGASAAYHLTLRGASVTVIDRPRAGRATDAGAGIICPWVDHDGDDAWYRLALEGARYYATLAGLLAEDGEPDTSYAPVGALVVDEDPARLAPVEALLRRRRPSAPDMGDVSAVDRPADLFPPLDPGLAALRVEGAARVDGRVVRDALERAAVGRGARVRGGAAALTSTGTPLLDGTVLDADAVIVAAGAWTGEVCRPMGLAVPVGPRRGQIVHAELPGADAEGWPIVLPRRGPYLLGFPGSRVVLGTTVEDAGFDPRATVGGVAEVLSGGVRIAPGLAGATVIETRSGLRPVTADGRPLLGPIGGHGWNGGGTGGTRNVVVATGLGAYGLTAGPYAGMVAACLALGERPPLDISPYSARPDERGAGDVLTPKAG